MEFVGTSCENCLFRTDDETGCQVGCEVGMLQKFAGRGEVHNDSTFFNITGRRCPLAVLKGSDLSKLPKEEILKELNSSNEPTFKVCLIVKPDSSPELVTAAVGAIQAQTRAPDAVAILCHNSIKQLFDLGPGWNRRTNYPVKKFENETWFYLYEEGRMDIDKRAWDQYMICCFPTQPLPSDYIEKLRNRVVDELEPIYTTEQTQADSPFVFDFLVGMKLVREDEGKTPEFRIHDSIDELGIPISKP